MELVCRHSGLKGEVRIPASKSHTIRAVAIAGLAQGQSLIRAPLDSRDTRAAVAAYRALGAQIECSPEAWRVRGTAGEPRVPEDVIDVQNSGVSPASSSTVLSPTGTPPFAYPSSTRPLMSR